MRFTLLLVAALAVAANATPFQNFMNSENAGGKKWALLIAGSNTWGNYRHQADIYHSYQIMKAGGLAEENIVVMHYDDIANSAENPKKGTVINKPDGHDVYKGVPKDYTGAEVTAKNFLAVLAGDKSAVNGGSGKVIASGPNDEVFVYFADHGGPGILGMPEGQAFLYGKDVVAALKAKHAAKGFKQLVFYIEACESGSIFEGALPTDIKIYATTAANAQESSWGCYCPGMKSPPPTGYNTCLGDLYSIAWMENTDAAGRTESFLKQYQLVKNRVSQNGTYTQGSHVMQYGELDFDNEELDQFMGDTSAENALPAGEVGGVNNRDANLIHLGLKHPELLAAELAHRQQLDQRVLQIVTLLAGKEDAHAIMTEVRTPVVEDWDCYKGNFESLIAACGKVGDYGMKHGRAMANLCNAGVKTTQVASAAKLVCQA